MSSQVNVHEYEIESKSRQVDIILARDCEIMLEVLIGRPDCIVNGEGNR